MLIDLHIHSTFSDGVYTPTEIVQMSAAAGLKVIAITDHDIVDGIAEAKRAIAKVPNAPRLLSGVELGTMVNDTSVHILGYNINTTNQQLICQIASMVEAREKRLLKILAKIANLGYYVTAEECDPKNRAVGRPHVAKALVKKGYFTSVAAAFEVLLKKGKPGYEPQPRVSVTEACKLIHQAGGITVLAHPAEIENDSLVEYLLKNVAFDALEVYHPSADLAAQEKYRLLAESLGLLISGGSDFHGVSGRFPEKIGEFEVDYNQALALLKTAGIENY